MHVITICLLSKSPDGSPSEQTSLRFCLTVHFLVSVKFKKMNTLSTQVTQEMFGTIQTSNGIQSVKKFTLTNLHGVKVQLITYGATLTNLYVPDKKGQLQDVVLGFDDMDGKCNKHLKINPFPFTSLFGP